MKITTVINKVLDRIADKIIPLDNISDMRLTDDHEDERYGYLRQHLSVNN